MFPCQESQREVKQFVAHTGIQGSITIDATCCSVQNGGELQRSKFQGRLFQKDRHWCGKRMLPKRGR